MLILKFYTCWFTKPVGFTRLIKAWNTQELEKLKTKKSSSQEHNNIFNNVKLQLYVIEYNFVFLTERLFS